MALCCGGEATGEGKAQAKVNKDITEQIKVDSKARGGEVRLLLLGAGESGKSTIAKQMKIIHMGGFNDEEKRAYVSAIHVNIWDAMQSLVNASEIVGIPISSTEHEELAKYFQGSFTGRLSPEQANAAEVLWQDPDIQQIYAQRNMFQLNDSCKYFMEEIKRVTAPQYTPTDQDILRSRIQTTGIIETKFIADGKNYTIVDVGGQRSERKKWMHCFEDVTGVIYCVGLSGFDQTLYEDNKTNRMQESLKLFHEICQSKWFTSTAIILFLNKDDLFREKIKQGKSIQSAFPEYQGPQEYQPSLKFIQDKFSTVSDPTTNKPRNIYTHITCATDTTAVQAVFNACKDFIMQQAFAAAGLQ